MRHILTRFWLLSFFWFFATSANSQVDITDRTLDIRNQIRTLWQKSSEDIAPNIIALPILGEENVSGIELPFFLDKEGLYTSTIIQGQRAESHLFLENVELEYGERIIVSSVDGAFSPEVIGPKRIPGSGRLFIGPFKGDISIEVNAEKRPEINLKQVYSQPLSSVAVDLGFDASFKCHVNINCEEGSLLKDEKRSVVRIRMVADEGVALCTGTLMNNTRGDREPYVLTAFHCLVPPTGTLTPFYDMWLFDFNYEGFSCANPEEEPAPHTVQGTEKLSEWEDTDMMLLRILGEVPKEANAFFAGWNRDLSYEPDTTYLIHHPVGDIKKISIDFDTSLIHDKNIGWNNGSNSPPSSHYISDFDEATYQPGSSGAGLFDKHGHVLGQLHGGPLSDEFCTLGIGYSGRVSVSWNTGDGPTTRLRDWLDPLDAGFSEIDGLDAISNEAVSLTGRIVTADGLAIPNVRVSLSGDQDASFLTGNDGRFVFDNLDPSGRYDISVEKTENVGNGLSATDLVIIRNHIIGRRSIEDQFALKSADVSGDGSISSVDLVQIRNIIIGRQDQFPSNPSWDFEPNLLQMDGTNTPSSNAEITIIGFKLGDVNYSAKPGN